MGDLQQDLIATLTRTAERLRAAHLPEDLARQMERLAQQVDQPCVVAVVGRVKAGKSTFINALLGEDLARTGVVETTATINYFRHGQPRADRPVRCHWRSGQVTDETAAFLDGLQGADLETLRRAEGIDHLEYHLLTPYLERVTLVDTPGTGAVVEAHQQRTAEFLRLSTELRQRQDHETQRLGGEADAVIYLVEPSAGAGDRELLEEFQQATGGRSKALNAVGVLAKVDLQPAIAAQRLQIAARVARALASNLNTVVPVSAGVRRALDGLLAEQQAGLRALQEALVSIPPARLEKFLASEDLYLDSDPPDCPVSRARREQLRGTMPWTVFTTIARVLGDPTLELATARAQLETLAGFDALEAVLERHFFARSHVLRSFRIVGDARRLLSTIKFVQLPELRQLERENEARRQRFTAFIRQAGGDPTVARELETFIDDRLARTVDVEGILKEAERDCARLFHVLEEYNADFEALQVLDEIGQPGSFSAVELDELRALLGLYGTELDKRLPAARSSVAHVEERQQHWSQVATWDREPLRRSVADRAVTRYGMLLDELLGS